MERASSDDSFSSLNGSKDSTKDRVNVRLGSVNLETLHSLAGFGKGREKKTSTRFTLQEDLSLIKYVAKVAFFDCYSSPTSVRAVVSFCEAYPEIAARHTVQSIYTRLRDQIKKKIDSFKIPAVWKFRITGNRLYEELAKKEGDKAEDEFSRNFVKIKNNIRNPSAHGQGNHRKNDGTKNANVERKEASSKPNKLSKKTVIQLVSESDSDSDAAIPEQRQIKRKSDMKSASNEASDANNSVKRGTPVSQRKSYTKFVDSIKASSSPKKRPEPNSGSDKDTGDKNKEAIPAVCNHESLRGYSSNQKVESTSEDDFDSPTTSKSNARRYIIESDSDASSDTERKEEKLPKPSKEMLTDAYRALSSKNHMERKAIVKKSGHSSDKIQTHKVSLKNVSEPVPEVRLSGLNLEKETAVYGKRVQEPSETATGSSKGTSSAPDPATYDRILLKKTKSNSRCRLDTLDYQSDRCNDLLGSPELPKIDEEIAPMETNERDALGSSVYLNLRSVTPVHHPSLEKSPYFPRNSLPRDDNDMESNRNQEVHNRSGRSSPEIPVIAKAKPAVLYSSPAATSTQRRSLTRPINTDACSIFPKNLSPIQTQSTSDSSADPLKTDYEMLILLADINEVSPEQILFALFINNGCPLAALEWLNNAERKTNDFSFVVDNALLKDGSKAIKEGFWRSSYGEESLLVRLDFLSKDKNDIDEILKTCRKSTVDIVRTFHKDFNLDPK